MRKKSEITAMNENSKSADEMIPVIEAYVVSPRPAKVVPYGTPEWCKLTQDECDKRRAEIENLESVCRIRRRAIWILITALVCCLLYFTCADSGIGILLALVGIPCLSSWLKANNLFTE